MASFRLPLKARRALTLVEVLIASMISGMVVVGSISSVVYYQRVAAKNDRTARIANLLEGQMEAVLSKSWFELSDGERGAFPPGGPPKTSSAADIEVAGTWPAVGATPVRRVGVGKLAPLNLVADSNDNPYTGVGGTITFYYTPFTLTHTAASNSSVVLGYDVNYYKVEVVYMADEAARVREGSADKRDVWSLVTYASELGGRTDAEFEQQVLNNLRSRRRVVGAGS